MSRWRKEASLRYLSPTPKIVLLGVGFILMAGFLKGIEHYLLIFAETFHFDKTIDFKPYFFGLLSAGVISFFIAIVEKFTRKESREIKYIVKRRLCAFYMGNPLQLRDGELEPKVTVFSVDNGGYRIRIECASVKFEDVSKLESVISDSLRKRFGNYAVVFKLEDVAGKYVDYIIKDVIAEYQKQSIYKTVGDIPSDHVTRLYIRDDVFVDYSRVLNASALLCGGTRSGKSTAAISVFLLPVLKCGPDEYGSKVIVVDPKTAELSQCDHVLCPDVNGGVEHILTAVREFNQTRISRQQIINDKGKQRGKVVKWFQVGMKPCILFLDEWVSLVDLFPKKASKENLDYCINEFLGLVRQIATQGASAGCFLVISTAQASVGIGGLESVVNNACGIRILFKPNRDDASFMWDRRQIEVMRELDYLPGDAWYSIDDGFHNQVGFVKFPRLMDEFDEYKALSDLLKEYYKS